MASPRHVAATETPFHRSPLLAETPCPETICDHGPIRRFGIRPGQRFLTTDAVLLEIGNALARKYRGQAVEIIEGFLSSEDVEVVRLTAELFAKAFALYKAHEDKEWGLIDCVSFTAMREANIQDALTFDQHFVQAGFRAVMRDAE